MGSGTQKRIAAVRKERKECKLYLWDWSTVRDEGARFKNVVASHLLKFCTLLREDEGFRIELHHVRDTSGREVDFLVCADGRPWFAVEAKLSDRNVSRNLVSFRQRLGIPYCFQVLRDGGADFEKGGVRVIPASRFLAALA